MAINEAKRTAILAELVSGLEPNARVDIKMLMVNPMPARIDAPIRLYPLTPLGRRAIFLDTSR